MEQRRLRLGDILDDYCPRERRVTNHAIVAMIEEDIKQTRCTTCDTEHAYKGARVPRRRKSETPATLYKEVLAAAAAPDAVVDTIEEPETMGNFETPEVNAAEPEPVADPAEVAETTDEVPPAAAVEDGPVHRPLIRATLPRPEGQKVERPIPEFTIRHSNGRNGHFRGGDARLKARPHGGNGNRPHGRFAGGPRPGAPGRPTGRGGGAGAGFRSGPPRHGGRKRSR